MFLDKLNKDQKQLRKRIIEIIHAKKTSHIGSCFTAVDTIHAVYKIKKPQDSFVLSSGHAAVALYAVLETKGYLKKDEIPHLNIHPDKNDAFQIAVSTGSLGQGLPIALGMALANKDKTIYCLISDGECSEGSIWESLRIAQENKLGNLVIIVNANGYGAYGEINRTSLKRRLKAFIPNFHAVNGHDLPSLVTALKEKNPTSPLLVFAKTQVNQLPFLSKLDAHYRIMQDTDYLRASALLS